MIENNSSEHEEAQDQESELVIKEFPIALIEEYVTDKYLDKHASETISLVLASQSELDDLLNELSDGASKDNVVEIIRERIGDDLAYAIFSAYDNTSGESLLQEALEESSWKNSLSELFADDERNLKFKPRRKSPAKATYESLLSDSNHISYIEIALPATGIRITLEPMSPRAFALLRMRVAKEKVLLNRRIYGSKFDLNLAVADAYILETIMKCVIGSNLKDWTADTLINIFDDRDFDYLCLMMILPYYPKGYNLRLQCTNVLPETLSDEEEEDLDSDNQKVLKPVNCGHYDLLSINLQHTLWYNHSLVQPERFAMSGTDVKVSYDDIMAFKEEEQFRNNIIAKDNWEIELQPCTTISRLIENRRWLGGIEKELVSTFNNNVSEAMMLERFSEVMTIEELRNYIPYVKTYRVYTDETREELVQTKDLSSIENRDPTITLLKYLNAADDFLFILDGITKFIKTNQYTLPAYANRPCSKCGKPHRKDEAEENIRLIPMDAKRIFFTIMEQKLERTVA